MFNSRQKHAYQTICSDLTDDTEGQRVNGAGEGDGLLSGGGGDDDTTSVTTQLTTLTYADGSVAEVRERMIDGCGVMGVDEV